MHYISLGTQKYRLQEIPIISESTIDMNTVIGVPRMHNILAGFDT